MGNLAVTTPEAAARTIAAHKQAFADAGLADAWSRVVALVVQPGVEFDNVSVIDYDPRKAVGVDGALAHVHSEPYGSWLLGAVAVGLLVFAAYSLFEARYRRL